MNTWPVRRARLGSTLQRKEIVLLISLTPRAWRRSRHLVRATDCRAAESGLRALDLYHLLVFCARPGGAAAEPVSLPVLELSGGVQPQPDFRDRRAHGPSLSGVD